MQIAFPWNDRQGRFAPLKALALAGVFAPGLWIGGHWLNGTLGAKPLEVALHLTGLWAIRLLLITLAITPLRAITGWNRLLQIRRILGLSVLAYVLIHLLLYVVQMKFNLWIVTREIALRIYLTVGFAAVLALVAMGSTSTDAAVRRMGAERWGRLHQLIYVLTPLAILHATMQAKIDISEEVIQFGLFMVLMGARWLRHFGRLDTGALFALALASAPISAGFEALWYGTATGVPWMRVAMANLDPAFAPRPSLIVLLIAMILPLLALVRRWTSVAGTDRATARDKAIETTGGT